MTDKGSHRKAKVIVALGAAVATNAYLHRKGYAIPGHPQVRCSRGHEFTTLWISGVSWNSLRLAPLLRYQRCPECRHWRLVRPVKPSAVEEPVAA